MRTEAEIRERVLQLEQRCDTPGTPRYAWLGARAEITGLLWVLGEACPIHGTLDMEKVGDHFECGQCHAEAEEATWS